MPGARASVALQLSDWQLAQEQLRERLRRDASWAAARHLSPQALRDAARALRRPPGRPARARRTILASGSRSPSAATRHGVQSSSRTSTRSERRIGEAQILWSRFATARMRCSRTAPTRALLLSHAIPCSDAQRRVVAVENAQQRSALASGRSGAQFSVPIATGAASVPRQSEQHDRHAERARRGLNNRVPGAVLGSR